MTREFDVDDLISVRQRVRQAATVALLCGTHKSVDVTGRNALLGLCEALDAIEERLAVILEEAAVQP